MEFSVWMNFKVNLGKFFWIPFGLKRVLVINDVDMVKKLLISTNPEHLNKPNEITDNVFTHWLLDGLLNSQYPIWSSHRKMLNHCFTYNCLTRYLGTMNKNARDLTTSLINGSNKNNDEIPDANYINETIHYHLVKIIADIVMGNTSLTNEVVVDFAKSFSVFKQGMLELVLNPLVRIPLFRHFNPKTKNLYQAVLYMDNFFKKITNKYRRQHEQDLTNSQENALKDFAVDMGLKPNRCLIQEMLYQNVQNKEIVDEVATFMIAGHETSHIALQMLMLHLALNPVHQTFCRDEVDQLINQKMNKNNLNDLEVLNNLDFNMGDLAGLKYLERCIHESARITPTVPVFMRKLDCSLDFSSNLVLPSGTIIVVPVWTIHRDPDNFPNPHKFNPDRFLPENVKRRNPYAFIPFSAGPRNCIGSKMALLKMKVIMAWILRHFEIYSNDKLEDVKLLFEATLKPDRYYNVVLKRRRF